MPLRSWSFLVAADGLHVLGRRAEPRIHRVDGDVCCPKRAPPLGLGCPLLLGNPTYVQARLNAYRFRIPACLRNVTTQTLDGLAHPLVERPQREPTVGHASSPAQPYVRPCPHPHRDGTLHGQGVDARLVDAVVLTLVADHLLGPQQAHHLYLLLDPSTTGPEVFAQRLKLHRVPADSHSKAQPSAAKNIYLGSLFGDERGLPLGQDDDTADEFEPLRDGSQVAKKGQRLMEHCLVGISPPAFTH